ncbi:type VII secretion effector (TIGR04197 family) [Breznakia sp. PF5-3]|uniref:TIGR04197 family type VII secretion effector n=1 Tax=unclassified Breznakia TaxID=2623764 RepID=UPI002405CA35|nr:MULTISPECIES: TIGR04197 family type VII secretion effector [unclassified Breznakia]MDF9824270.1 type VII secretion effector (TIGR04197 family) [Breznakia sp. PM6-1]MDF9835494.1 type VII secretion effector (TIGR04197 family) [Breznakia sp. PF5-3]MDF9838032.1 type VII secretion effector (TIGR04197 family) [Breznakia sp. PFB2-8]MDF9859410.1 type VII secretion effector (TIGR04197 family) [Breznakia sp. PH5-24]
MIKSNIYEADNITNTMQRTTEKVLGVENDANLAVNTTVAGNIIAMQCINQLIKSIKEFSSAYSKDSKRVHGLAKAFNEVDESMKNRIKYRAEWDALKPFAK